MTGWVILAVYIAGYIGCWRSLCWFFITDFAFTSKPDGEEIFLGILMGSLLGFLWPGVLIVAAARRVYLRNPESVVSLITPRAYKREVELKNREERIETLERELNIK